LSVNMVSAPETKVTDLPTGEDNVEKAESSENVEQTDGKSMEAEAYVKLNLGKKAMLLRSFQEAVDNFAEACALMAEVYGDMALEMCDFHFNYGKALLELARIEESVLGNALDGVGADSTLENSQVEDPDKLSPEEKEEVAEKVDEALAENFNKKKNRASDPSESNGEGTETELEKPKVEVEAKEKSEENKDVKDQEEKEEVAMETEKSEAPENGESEDVDEDASPDSGEESQDDSQDEDVPTLQLAYEVFEIAKTIYLKLEKRSEEDNLKLAQVYLKLGDVAAENERYEESVQHYGECLNIQELFLSGDDRLLAETSYQLGCVHLLDNNPDLALTHIESAAKVIKLRMSNKIKVLNKQGIEYSKDLPEDGSWSSQVKSVVKDIKDLDALLPELEEKLSDCKEAKTIFEEKVKGFKEMAKEVFAAASSVGETTSTGPFGSPSTPSSEAKPISATMIRKKRKPEEEVQEEPAKKSRTESAENGSEASTQA